MQGSQMQGSTQNAQQAAQRALEAPLEQTLQFQKTGAEIFLNGLEIMTWTGTRGVDLTKQLLQSYIRTVEDTVRSTEMIGMQAMQPQQAMQQFGTPGMQGGQQMTPQQGGMQQQAQGMGGQQYAAQPPAQQMTQPPARMTGQPARSSFQEGEANEQARSQGISPESQ